MDKKEKARLKQQARRDRQRATALPPHYVEEGDRMMSMQTRVDIRRMASICAFMENRFGQRPKDRSEMIRDALDLLYVSIQDDKKNFQKFNLHREAYDFLNQRGLVPDLETRDGERFERITLASESYDIEHHGLLETQMEKDFEHVEYLMDMKRVPVDHPDIVQFCRDHNISHSRFVEWKTGKSEYDFFSSGTTPDTSPIVDKEHMKKKAFGSGKKSAGDAIASPDFIRRQSDDE